MDSAHEVPEVLRQLDANELFLLGGGSNVLISDRGLDAPVVIIRAASRAPSFEIDGEGMIELDAAASWADVAGGLSRQNIMGLESLVGIPGTVGGAIVQNIGAYGYELSDRLQSVLVYDRATRNCKTLSNAECGFGYRTSRFKRSFDSSLVIVSARLQLVPNGLHAPRYRDLEVRMRQSHRGQTRESYFPTEVMDVVLGLRGERGMLYEPDNPETRGVGSFFVNPVITRDQLVNISKRCGVEESAIPHWPTSDGLIKIGAGWLLENAGFKRGFRAGGVGLSSKHALSIVNMSGECTSEDVLGFATLLRKSVLKKFEILLQLEPVLMGFTDEQLNKFGLTETPMRAGYAGT